MRRIGVVAAVILGLYFIARAIVEVAIVDYGNPDSYRLDWGGPSLVGVLAVHCGPGVIAAVLMVWWVRRRAARRRGAGESGASGH